MRMAVFKAVGSVGSSHCRFSIADPIEFLLFRKSAIANRKSTIPLTRRYRVTVLTSSSAGRTNVPAQTTRSGCRQDLPTGFVSRLDQLPFHCESVARTFSTLQFERASRQLA